MAAFTDDIFFATIPELNAKLKVREFSAVELVRAFAQRLEALGPRYNALALALTASAIRRAQLVDKELKRDRTRGPLHRRVGRRVDLVNWIATLPHGIKCSVEPCQELL